MGSNGRVSLGGRAAAVLAIALGAGCEGGRGDRGAAGDAGAAGRADAAATPIDAAVPGDARCAAFIVPNRMGYRWERLNHRISVWRFHLVEPPDGCEAEALRAHVVGGDFSTGERLADTPILEYGWQRVRNDAGLGVARVRFTATIPPSGVVEETATLSPADLGLGGYPRVVALIEGFGFDTAGVEQPPGYPDDYDPAHGYTSRGLGAAVEVRSADPDRLTVAWRLRFGFGAAPDRRPHNTALAHAHVRGDLDILLLGLPDAAAVEIGAIDYTLTYEKPPPGTDPEIAPADPAQQTLELDGAAGLGVGLHGLRRFDFELSPDTNCEEDADCPRGDTCGDDGRCDLTHGAPGYYLRELTVDAVRDGYDPETGRGRFRVEGYASNATPLLVFNALQSHFTAEIAWVQAPGLESTPHRLDQPFATGESTFPLAAGDP